MNGDLDDLREWLTANDFNTGPNNLAGQDNGCKWYAWRRLPADSRDCECNDKPPSLIVTPQLYVIRDRQYMSAEVAVTGQLGEWFQLKAHSVNVGELPAALPGIEAALVRAWNALESSK
jgi:hypothetical protein